MIFNFFLQTSQLHKTIEWKKIYARTLCAHMFHTASFTLPDYSRVPAVGKRPMQRSCSWASFEKTWKKSSPIRRLSSYIYRIPARHEEPEPCKHFQASEASGYYRELTPKHFEVRYLHDPLHTWNTGCLNQLQKSLHGILKEIELSFTISRQTPQRKKSSSCGWCRNTPSDGFWRYNKVKT